MKKIFGIVLTVLLLAIAQPLSAQCSICTKTAQQLGYKPAKGLNSGIIYLMFAPFAIMGVVGYNYYKSRKNG